VPILNIRENKKVIKMPIIQGKHINTALPYPPLLAAIHSKDPVLVDKLIFS